VKKIEVILFFYLIVIGITSHLLCIPEAVKAFLALPSFLVLPWLFGNSLLYISERLFHRAPQRSVWAHFIFSWLIGVFSLSVLSAMLQFFKQSAILANLHILVLLFITLSLVYKSFLQKSKERYQVIISRYSHNLRVDLLLCISIGLIPALIARIHVPFGFFGYGYMLPTIINQPALRMIEHGYMDLSLRWPEYLLTALSCMIFNCEPMSFNWSLPFLLAPLYSIGLYLLSYKLFKNRMLSLLTALFGPFINVGTTYRTLFFGQFIENPRSNTILYSIFPLTLLLTQEKISDKYYKIRDVIVSLFTLTVFWMAQYILVESAWFRAQALGLPRGYRLQVIRPIAMLIAPLAGSLIPEFFLANEFSKANFTQLLLIALVFQIFHEKECLLFILTLLLYILLIQLSKKKAVLIIEILNRKRMFNLSRLAFYMVIISAFLFIFLQWINVLNIYSSNLLSSLLWSPLGSAELRNTFIVKRLWFEDANSPIILALLIVGLFHILLSKDRKKLLILTMFSLTLLIYFLPDFWTYRAYKEFSPFMAIVLAISVCSIYELIFRTLNWLNRTNINKYLAPLALALMLSIIIPTLVFPVYTRFSFTYSNQQYYTCIADYEYQAALWLKENTPENTKIISDYRTMVLIIPLSNKIWLTDRQMNVLSLPDEDRQLVSYIKNNIFLAPDSKHAYEAIWNLSNRIPWQENPFLECTGLSESNITFVVIISARTVKWIEQQGIIDVAFPQYVNVNPKYLEIFLDTNYFELLLNIDDKIYVFKVKDKD